MPLNLGAILTDSARWHPERIAVCMGETKLTYGALDRAARGVATALYARGLEPGQHVALFVPNVPEFSIAYFGILYAGCAVVPLNVLLSPREITYHLKDSEAKLLVAHPFFGENARRGAADTDVPIVWTNGESPHLHELAQSEPLAALHPTDGSDTAVLLYTSGTTGTPKGAELTHVNLLLNAALVVPRLIPITRDDVALGALPLFHSFGQTCIQNAVIAGAASFTLLPRFTAEQTFEIIERDRVSVFAGVPSMYFALLHHESERTYDLSSLRFCLSGGAPMPVEVMHAFEGRFGIPILEGYGLSETSPVTSFNVLDRPRKPGSIGYPVWGVEMAIADPEGGLLGDEERGEIVIRGHNVMKGYFRRPEETAASLRGGWFHTGDVGIRDAEGCYRIVDRVKDMILRGGFNVYPREVEEVLYTHPSVAEVAVIGVPNEEHGEEVKAVIALKPGQSLTEKEVIAFCKERLAAYKYPRIVEFVSALPKGPTGKILKRELR